MLAFIRAAVLVFQPTLSIDHSASARYAMYSSRLKCTCLAITCTRASEVRLAGAYHIRHIICRPLSTNHELAMTIYTDLVFLALGPLFCIPFSGFNWAYLLTNIILSCFSYFIFYLQGLDRHIRLQQEKNAIVVGLQHR